MFLELRRLYRRFQDLHSDCRFPPFALKQAGTLLGYVEECSYGNGQLRLSGWTLLHRLCVEMGDRRYPLQQRISRGDVAAALGERMMSTGNAQARVGFDVLLPSPEGPARLWAEDAPGAGPWDLPMPDATARQRAKRQSQRLFLRRLAGAAPLGLRYLLSGRRPALHQQLRQALGLQDRALSVQALDPAVLALLPSAPAGTAPVPDLDAKAGGAPDHPPAPDRLSPAPAAAVQPVRGTASGEPVTILLPVYNAFELLTEALDRVERHTDLPWHLVLIEDASPDPRIRPWLQDWAAARSDRVTLLLNSVNLGFIGSVNRGFDLVRERGGAVILLNSDAMVPAGWASRLLAPLRADESVASVTPMSNDATILTVPWVEAPVDLRPGAVDRIDALACQFLPVEATPIPTGVGFCMAINPKALAMVPSFDPAFGRGYGEEVDWCCKTAAAGMKHLGTGALFVEHRGGSSFGLEIKAEAIRFAGETIRARHPGFDQEVQRFIARDPLRTQRLALALCWAESQAEGALPLYLAHSQGGGAEHWLRAEIASRSAAGQPSLVMRTGGLRRFKLELHAGGRSLEAETDSAGDLCRLLWVLSRRRVIYSCGVGDPRPWELPQLLCDLAAGEGSSLEILFHDYFPVSPSYNLLNMAGHYAGVPGLEDQDPAHQITDGRDAISLRDWRRLWGAAIARAERLTVFSASSAEIVTEAWPEEAKGKIICRPHPQVVQMPRLAPPKGPGRIGILGAIGAEKGAALVAELAQYLDQKPGAPGLVIIGEFDGRFPLPASALVTGRYRAEDLAEMLPGYGIGAWLMPSICPETFSFTTREMLATGLPVMAFDLGAQAEAVRASPNGHVVVPSPAEILKFYQDLQAKNAI